MLLCEQLCIARLLQGALDCVVMWGCIFLYIDLYQTVCLVMVYMSILCEYLNPVSFIVTLLQFYESTVESRCNHLKALQEGRKGKGMVVWIAMFIIITLRF